MNIIKIRCDRGERDPNEGRYFVTLPNPDAPGHLLSPETWPIFDTFEEAENFVMQRRKGAES